FRPQPEHRWEQLRRDHLEDRFKYSSSLGQISGTPGAPGYWGRGKREEGRVRRPDVKPLCNQWFGGSEMFSKFIQCQATRRVAERKYSSVFSLPSFLFLTGAVR